MNATAISTIGTSSFPTGPMSAGHCQSCGQVSAVAGYSSHGTCPGCGRAVTLEAVKGTYSNVHNCDDSCLFARGPICVCSCGGHNHRRGYLVWTLVPESVKARNASDHTRKIAARKAKADAKIAKWVGQDAARTELVAWLQVNAGTQPNLSSILAGLERYGYLMYYQEAAVRRAMTPQTAAPTAPVTPVPAQARTNRYGGKCIDCGVRVPANGGLLIKNSSGWAVQHRSGEC